MDSIRMQLGRPVDGFGMTTPKSVSWDNPKFSGYSNNVHQVGLGCDWSQEQLTSTWQKRCMKETCNMGSYLWPLTSQPASQSEHV